jgi:hypothetical protein
MDKKLIHSLLVINSGDEAQRVRANIVEALRLILEGIQADEVRQEHSMRFVATSIGFLASSCYREAARAAEQAMTGVALPAVSGKATPRDLLQGLLKIDRPEL